MDQYDELDGTRFDLSEVRKKKVDVTQKLVQRLTEQGCYNNPDSKNMFQVLIPSGGDSEVPTRLKASFYHNYHDVTIERLESMAQEFEDWSTIMGLGDNIAAKHVCERIRARLRYSRPSVTVMPCKSKKLQASVPQCTNPELAQDIELFNSLQNKIRTMNARLKEITSAEDYAMKQKAAIEHMRALGLHSVPYMEHDPVTGEDIMYQVVLNEKKTKKKTTKKHMLATILRLMKEDKTATQSFAAFRLRLVEELQKNVEYSKTTNLTLAIKTDDLEDDDEFDNSGAEEAQ